MKLNRNLIVGVVQVVAAVALIWGAIDTIGQTRKNEAAVATNSALLAEIKAHKPGLVPQTLPFWAVHCEAKQDGKAVLAWWTSDPRRGGPVDFPQTLIVKAEDCHSNWRLYVKEANASAAQ